MEVLNDKNFMLYAAKFYDNKNCVDILEFHDDLNRIKYLKRLFKKYRETGDIKVQLVINHLIVVYNVFHPQAATRMLAFKLDQYLEYLKPFLLYLSFWPKRIELTDKVIIDSEVGQDEYIIKQLREYNKNG